MPSLETALLRPVSESARDPNLPLKGGPNVHYVRLPDLFSSFMAAKPTVNPNYFHVKPKADSWITRIMKATPEWEAKNSRADMAYLASLWAPNCDEDTLRVLVDWCHWLILFDDQFDEGHLSNDIDGAHEEIEINMGIMNETQPWFGPNDDPIRHIFQTIWDRVKKNSSADLQQHWKDMHKIYFDGLILQIEATCQQKNFTRNVDEYMEMRRGTIAAHPGIALVGFAWGIALPPEVINHPSLQECMCVIADLTLFANDILSYKKDLALGVEQNLVMLLTKQGLSTQEAMDKISAMLDDCYKRWYSALANLPWKGEKIDRQVLRFVDCCRNVALGGLHWSFKTGRYLGSDGDQVYETRMLSLP
ncbi:Presilphiperfolan-8-beta-ol synthase [Biscogniauxia sp. FL1348]|nr:Presilphiperfolan-8-beta-ol synthase [Biscogniauxia sp. FL1348]